MGVIAVCHTSAIMSSDKSKIDIILDEIKQDVIMGDVLKSSIRLPYYLNLGH